MNLSTPIPLSFTTKRLLVRRYETTDEEALFNAARSSISEVFPYLPWCHPDYAQSEAKEWLSNVDEDWKSGKVFNFAIFDRKTDEFHGGCGINRIDEHPIGNLGYWIKTGSTGRGIASEASRGLADFGFKHLGLRRIEIVMSVRNEASRKVAIATGAELEGTLRNRLHLHGADHDAYSFSLVP